MKKHFKNPDKNFVQGNFKTTKQPKTPSPKRKNYQKKAQTQGDNFTKCTYIHPTTGKRCKNLLGLYPQFCELHTMMIQNVYISKSQIDGAGNGLFVGPYGFKKGDIIGRYSYPQNEVRLKTLTNRCDDEKNCWSYTFCEEGMSDNTKCWDALDIRTTVIRNINDAHGSQFKNNAYFSVIGAEVYAIASRRIRPHKEIFINYGKNYWS